VTRVGVDLAAQRRADAATAHVLRPTRIRRGPAVSAARRTESEPA
jgi:hypothetical protein